MRIRILAAGKPALAYAKSGVEEYLKRLGRYGSHELEFLKAGDSESVSAALVERRMVMKDGQHAPGAPHRGMRMHRFGGMMGGHMFDMADANKDGRVTLQEATDAAARHFDMADANRDGRITPDERRQMHRQMIEKRRAPKAG